MEEYGQRWGLILYRIHVPASAFDKEAVLEFGAPIHDFATVYVDGQLAGKLDRSSMKDAKAMGLQLPRLNKAKGEGGLLSVWWQRHQTESGPEELASRNSSMVCPRAHYTVAAGLARPQQTDGGDCLCLQAGERRSGWTSWWRPLATKTLAAT